MSFVSQHLTKRFKEVIKIGPSKRRTFKRPLGARSYRKLFIIAAEGAKTERLYFGIFDGYQSIIKVTCLKGKNNSSPQHVLKKMTDYLRKNGLKITDEAWLVVDKDEWTDAQLGQLYDWSRSQSNYGLAVSNPKFEYWLLLHFENGNSITSSRSCSERLKRHLPNYSKRIDHREFTQAMIQNAIRRAKQHDNPPVEDWPRNTGTTVYKLVSRLVP